MCECESDSFESIHDATSALGVHAHWLRARNGPDDSLGQRRSGRSGAAVKSSAQDEPDGQGDPFGVREMTRKRREQLHQKKQKRDQDAEGGDGAHAGARVD